MSSEAAKGQEAMKISDYPAAVKHYTAALKTLQSPVWLIQRSIALHRTGEYALSLEDADNALLASIGRQKRELIATSQFRRGVALHGLGRYGDARLCFLWCNKRNDKEKGLTMWMAKVKLDYEKAGGESAECNQTTVKEVPDMVEEAKKEKETTEKKTTAASIAPAAQTPTPKEKVRTEWYQSAATVTIEIFAKGVPKESAEVQIEESSLDVSFPIGAGSSYDYSLTPLFSKIDATKSTFRITSHKIEIVLHKSHPGLKWSALEGTELAPSTAESEPSSKVPAELLASKPTETAPVYPTSSRNGPKNWDKVIDDGAEESEGIDDFFKKLYGSADPDTKRAMMKSYQESGGTSLSTDWKDVKSKTFEISPPEGMEAKKWNS
ncbi:putative SGT1 and CS domain containing protein [Diplocarpon rosae]|nr:putative SGT1 and CS domain containing protein [Diplocarpon rosae]